MKPSAARKIERELDCIIRSGSDNCTLCGKKFPHNTRTVGGSTAAGIVGLAGECCAGKIKNVLISGFYLDRQYDIGSGTMPSLTAVAPRADPTGSIKILQGHFAHIDHLSSEIMTRAGVAGKASVNMSESPWKSDDAAWFKKNPRRSHRLRQMFVGELPTLFETSEIPEPPPDHEYQVLVRQVEPGKRVRRQFCRNLKTPLPDIEPLIHALFDVVTNTLNTAISASEVARLARMYAKTE